MKDLEDDEREFPIRVYTKVELALLYAPHLSENAALNNLSRWMYGYSNTSLIFYPQQLPQNLRQLLRVRFIRQNIIILV